MNGELRRQGKLKRQRRKRQARRQAFARADSSPLTLAELGMPKMSDTLVAFAQPILDELPDRVGPEQFENALLYAVVVWNILVVFEGDDQERQLRALSQRLASKYHVDSEVTHEGLMCLRDRKRELFPYDPRTVLNVSVTDRGGGNFYVQAASAFGGPEFRSHP